MSNELEQLEKIKYIIENLKDLSAYMRENHKELPQGQGAAAAYDDAVIMLERKFFNENNLKDYKNKKFQDALELKKGSEVIRDYAFSSDCDKDRKAKLMLQLYLAARAYCFCSDSQFGDSQFGDDFEMMTVFAKNLEDAADAWARR